MQLIENLEWRYATKKFDPSQKVSTEAIEKIKTAIQLSATSYGLQLFKIITVEDPALREKLLPHSWGQRQVVDASHLMVFCPVVDIQDEHIDSFVRIKSEVQGIPHEKLKGYGDFIKDKLSKWTTQKHAEWTTHQVYLALGNALAACAELRVDAAPLEGFDVAPYNEILGLNEKGLSAAVLLTIGYRSSEDSAQHLAKARRPKEELFEVV